MNPETDLLLDEETKNEEKSLINEDEVEYQEGVDETKQLYWLNKYIVAELRKKQFSNGDARRYADRNASRILAKAKANVGLTFCEKHLGVTAAEAGI